MLEHGAPVVQVYKDKTPLQVALNNKGSRCVKVGAVLPHASRVRLVVYPELLLRVVVAFPGTVTPRLSLASTVPVK